MRSTSELFLLQLEIEIEKKNEVNCGKNFCFTIIVLDSLHNTNDKIFCNEKIHSHSP